MADNFAISVDNVAKIYKLYQRPSHRIFEAFYPGKKKFHKPFEALKNISFTVEKGEFVGIIGKNGSGKSTLLQMVCGIFPPTEGKIAVNGRISALLELGAGFNPEFTGRQNVYLNATILGFSREEIDNKFDAIASFADIGEFIDQPIKMYSSGMVVRLAFAVQANVEPDILIVDEALSVGDSYFQAKCTRRMGQLIESGVTILYVSHDITSIPLLCSRAVYLEKGHIKKLGPAIDVVDCYLRDLRNEQYRDGILKHDHDSTLSEKVVSDPTCSISEPEDSKKNTSLDIAERNKQFAKKVSSYRYGTSGARITYIEMIGEDGHPSDSFSFREKVTIRASIQINKDLDALNCCAIIRNKHGVEVMHCTTREFGYSFDVVKKGTSLEVDICFENILKPMDAYTIHFTVNNTYSLENQEILDLIELATVFSVKPDPHNPIYYLIWHPFTFEHRVL